MVTECLLEAIQVVEVWADMAEALAVIRICNQCLISVY